MSRASGGDAILHPDDQEPLWPTIGIPKGRLYETTVEILKRVGYPLTEVAPRNYHPRLPGMHPFILKPRAIPQMVALGMLDSGFCGRDLVAESNYGERLSVVVDLGTQPVRLVVAAHDPELVQYPPNNRPLVIATEFALLADRWATGKNLAHICLNTWGSTEAWCPDYCDLIVDVVESGATLAANGLVLIEELMPSTTVLIARTGSPVLKHDLVRALKERP